MEIDVVMTTWKREPMTALALYSFVKNTKHKYRLIIADNGSAPEARAMYNDIADVYLNLSPNKGLEFAKNYAMQWVRSEYFISTDNDILVPNKPIEGLNWLTYMVDLMQRNPEYAAISMRPQVLIGTGDIFGQNPPEIKEFSHVPGYMRIMDTALTNKTGAWSDHRSLRGHEEYWISDKFQKMGKKVGWATKAHCYHMFSHDSNWGYEDMQPEDHGHNRVQIPIDDLSIMQRDFI